MVLPRSEHVHNQWIRNRAVQVLNRFEPIVHVSVTAAGGRNAFDNGVVPGIFQHVLEKIACEFHARHGAIGCKTFELRIHGAAFGHGLFQRDDHPIMQERIE